MSAWYEYVVKVAGTDNQTRIAEATGIKQSNLSRWKKGGKPEPAHAAKFATSYGRNVLEAFVAAGFLTPDEAGAPPAIERPLADIPGNELAAEVAKRLGTWSRSEAWPASSATFTDLRSVRDLAASVESLREDAERRSIERTARLDLHRQELSEKRAQAAVERDERIRTEMVEHVGDSPAELLDAYRSGEIGGVTFSSIIADRYFRQEGLREALLDAITPDLSAPADTPDLAIAAHEEETSIAGEQEESDTP